MNKNNKKSTSHEIVDVDLIYPDQLLSTQEIEHSDLGIRKIPESEIPTKRVKKPRIIKKTRKFFHKLVDWIESSKMGRAHFTLCSRWQDARNRIEFAYQRATKGWCNKDCWGFSYWFCSTAPKILRHLADNGIGYPSSPEIRKKMDELFPDYKHDGPEDEKYFGLWKQTIRYLAYLIENSDIDTCTFINYIECPDCLFNSVKLNKKKNADDKDDADFDDENTMYQLVQNKSVLAEFEKWHKAETDIENKVHKCREEMWDLFKFLFDNLWD